MAAKGELREEGLLQSSPLPHKRIKSLETKDVDDLFILKKTAELIGLEDKIKEAVKLAVKNTAQEIFNIAKKKLAEIYGEGEAQNFQTLKRTKLKHRYHKDSSGVGCEGLTVAVEDMQVELLLLPPSYESFYEKSIPLKLLRDIEDSAAFLAEVCRGIWHPIASPLVRVEEAVELKAGDEMAAADARRTG